MWDWMWQSQNSWFRVLGLRAFYRQTAHAGRVHDKSARHDDSSLEITPCSSFHKSTFLRFSHLPTSCVHLVCTCCSRMVLCVEGERYRVYIQSPHMHEIRPTVHIPANPTLRPAKRPENCSFVHFCWCFAGL